MSEQGQEWDGLAGWLATLDDMELVGLQAQARELDDQDTLNLILIELGKRERAARPERTD